MSNNKKIWFYDIEQFPNFHCNTFINRDNIEEVRVFVIFDYINDSLDYYRFLREEVGGLIGFNNINYDYPLLHYFMAIMQSYVNTPPDTNNINRLLYAESSRIISAEYSAIRQYDVKIPQLDLYRIHHFDNKNKATSLKMLEIVMRLDNVMEMPFGSDYYVKLGDTAQILNYNRNDVIAAAKFYLLTVSMIDMRKKLGKRYGLNFLNTNDPKIGETIFINEIAKRKGWDYRYLKDMRTYRHHIDLGECILPIIQFQSKEFKALLDEFKSTTIETTYKAFEKSVIYKGAKYDYGTGGIHSCIEPGIYEEDRHHMIIDIDVKSYYPNLAVTGKFYPQHLGIDFVYVTKDLFDQRVQAQKDGDSATNSGLKLALNGATGKANDKFSPLYDPKYNMSITVNGQLLLSILIEQLVDNIPDIVILQANTDGVTVRLNKAYDLYLYEICKRWEMTTKLTLEYQVYRKMVIRDVNNYYAIDDKGKEKHKGCFEIVPMQNGAIAYNKDWSKLVVPKALEAYYRDGIPVEDFIRNHDDIYDFCIGFRAHAGWSLYRYYAEDGMKKEEKIQKTIRYYISRTGDLLVKKNDDSGAIIQLDAGYSSTLFNVYKKKDMSEYNIDYGYYIAEANKIKYAVYDGQLKMF